LDWSTQRLINIFHSWSKQLQYICWPLGLKSTKQLVGGSDLRGHLDYDNRPDMTG